MPGLKVFASSFALDKSFQKSNNVSKTICHEPPSGAKGKLRRLARDRSDVSLDQSEPSIYDLLPERTSLQGKMQSSPSRQFSFVSGASLELINHPSTGADESTPDLPEDKQSKLFGRLLGKVNRSKNPKPTVDNFTKWDLPSTPANSHRTAPQEERPQLPLVGKFGLRIGPPHTHESPRLSQEYAAVRRSRSSCSDEYETADEDHSPNGVSTLAIGAIDWSKLNDEEARNVIASLQGGTETTRLRTDQKQHLSTEESEDAVESQPSPVDSANSFGLVEVPYVGKGKGRMRDLVVEPKLATGVQSTLTMSMDKIESSESDDLDRTRQSPSLGGGFDAIMAAEAALKAEMARSQQAWNDQIEKIQAMKETELERRRQEELERLARLEFLKQEKLRLWKQEEDDARAAFVLQEEERLDCLRREEEDRIRAEELAAQIAKQEEEERIAKELAAMRDCIVCGDKKSPSEYPILAVTDQCEHDVSTCTECLQAWMDSEFETKGSADIKCPECPQKLSFHDVQRAASAKTFQSYEKILTNNALSELADFGWCLRPGCGSGQLNEENNHYMDCVKCRYKQCLQHRVAWHEGETCAQYDYRTSGAKAAAEEKASVDEINKIAKKCPGPGCHYSIMKLAGCDHMTCRRCKHQFCWLCLASHKEIQRVGNEAHDASCKYHSKNLDVAWPFNVH